jgi:peptide/nickel transport system ATP-binding protein
MKELIKISGLTVKFYTYEGVVSALNQVNLTINREETLGLVGETGCGKTMIALSILRLVPSPGRIESGSIHFNITNTAEPPDLLTLSESQMREIRGSRISMVFQEPSAALNPVYTIGDQISEVILLHRRQELGSQAAAAVDQRLAQETGISRALAKPMWLVQRNLYRKIAQDPDAVWPRLVARIPLARRLLWQLRQEAEKATVSLLREVEIPDPASVIQRYPHQLSGGMKQRVVIAMALAGSPKFLIADEPTTSLDVTIQAQILELMRQLKKEHQSSVLYITHDLGVAAEICDRIGVMYAGSPCEIAPVEELYAHPLHPYTRALMAAVPRPGEEPHPIGGTVPDPIELPPGCRFHPRCSEATRLCQQQAPEMREVAPQHFLACHLFMGGDSGRPR